MDSNTDLGAIKTIAATSSVDGALLHGQLFLPDGFDPHGPKVPLVAVIRGGKGDPKWEGGPVRAVGAELNERGWIGMTIGGRDWPEGSVAWREHGEVIAVCEYAYSMSYANSPEPGVGPGLQDVVDMIEWAKATYPVDENRVYALGISLGGRGVYAIGLQAPDLFAALALMHPASDEFELDIRHFGGGRASDYCRQAVVGGRPGCSQQSATLRFHHSGRFLIENACNLPIFIGHGDDDEIAWNKKGTGSETYNHSYHMLLDSTWDGCHSFEGKQFCFGHTPTLPELAALHPDGYKHAYMFSHQGHRVDLRWITGAEKDDGEPSLVGVDHPKKPGHLIGGIEFIEQFERDTSPESVVFKTYTDDVRKAYWAAIDITTAWTATPGAIRARRNVDSNAIDVELARVGRVTLDLAGAGLAVPSMGRPLRVNVRQLNEPGFDPALTPAPGETLETTLVFEGDWAGIREIAIMVGQDAFDGRVTLEPDRLTVGPIAVERPVSLRIEFGESEDMPDG